MDKLHPRAHAHDPVSSFEAAERAVDSGMVKRHRELIIEALDDQREMHRLMGRPRETEGLSSRSISSRTGDLDRVAVARRMSELERDGLVVRNGKDINGEVRWALPA